MKPEVVGCRWSRTAAAPSEARPPGEGLADVLTLQRRAAAISDSADETAAFQEAVAEYTWARDVAGLAATTLGKLTKPVIELCDVYEILRRFGAAVESPVDPFNRPRHRASTA
jgi:integrase/recombinase XerC